MSLLSVSSSESSEDEEEASKISQAVVPDDFLASLSQSQALLPSLVSKSKTQNGTANCNVDERQQSVTTQLKSKRPDKDVHKEDGAPDGYFIKTTPEFRSHVAKHLSQNLDKQIEEKLKNGVWKKKFVDSKIRREKGIKLFYDAKAWCIGETAQPTNDNINQLKAPPRLRPKKHKLKDSSDSSDEEDKISSCVFSVDDIMHENKMLDNLSKCGVHPSNPEETKQQPKESKEGISSETQVKKKKKKLCLENENVYDKANTEDTGTVNIADFEDQPKKKVKKKKEKKKKMLKTEDIS